MQVVVGQVQGVELLELQDVVGEDLELVALLRCHGPRPGGHH